MSYQRKTKIVATVGPASETKESLIQLAKAGVNVFRLNFSHGTHEDHLQRLKTIREISKELDLNLSILQDLQGPKIRTQLVENNGVVLEAGKQLIFAMDENLLGTSEKVGTTYTSMYLDVNVGERILMDDGNLEVKVISIDSAKKADKGCFKPLIVFLRFSMYLLVAFLPVNLPRNRSGNSATPTWEAAPWPPFPRNL